jgi:hypothetical protein
MIPYYGENYEKTNNIDVIANFHYSNGFWPMNCLWGKNKLRDKNGSRLDLFKVESIMSQIISVQS